MLLPFLLTLFEWYEFSIYNTLIPYISLIIGAKSDLYLGMTILAFSFLVRPIGSIFFAAYCTNPLATSLKIMSFSTFMMAILPTAILPQSMLILWILCCKLMQSFALGGSYGLNYISVYEQSTEWRCYRTSFVQMGFLLGIIIGEVSMFIAKMSNGSIYGSVSDSFIAWGWRIPFLISGCIGSLLLIKSDGLVISKTKEVFKPNIIKYICIFLVIAIEMNIFYMWFVYSPSYREFASGSIFDNMLSSLQKGLMLILFPVMGILCDLFKSNSTVLLTVCMSIIALSPFAPWGSATMFFLSCIVGAACYASLIPWCLSNLTKIERRSVLGLLFSMASTIFGGTIPLTAVYVNDAFGLQYVGGVMLVYAILSIIALIFISRTENSIDKDQISE